MSQSEDESKNLSSDDIGKNEALHDIAETFPGSRDDIGKMDVRRPGIITLWLSVLTIFSGALLAVVWCPTLLPFPTPSELVLYQHPTLLIVSVVLGLQMMSAFLGPCAKPADCVMREVRADSFAHHRYENCFLRADVHIRSEEPSDVILRSWFGALSKLLSSERQHEHGILIITDEIRSLETLQLFQGFVQLVEEHDLARLHSIAARLSYMEGQELKDDPVVRQLLTLSNPQCNPDNFKNAGSDWAQHSSVTVGAVRVHLVYAMEMGAANNVIAKIMKDSYSSPPIEFPKPEVKCDRIDAKDTFQNYDSLKNDHLPNDVTIKDKVVDGIRIEGVCDVAMQPDANPDADKKEYEAQDVAMPVTKIYQAAGEGSMSGRTSGAPSLQLNLLLEAGSPKFKMELTEDSLCTAIAAKLNVASFSPQHLQVFDQVATMLQQAMAALAPPPPQPASPQPWDLAWLQDLAGPDAQWTVDSTMPSLRLAQVASTSQLFQLVNDLFSRSCRHGPTQLPVFDVVSVTAVHNTDLAAVFLHGLHTTNLRRGAAAVFNKPIGPGDESALAIQRLKDLFLSQDVFDRANVLFALHGCSPDVAMAIARTGAADLRGTDGGFHGAGIYTTMQAQYAAAYASGLLTEQVITPTPDGCYAVVLCLVAVGNVYPVTRANDYPVGSRVSVFHYRYPEGSAVTQVGRMDKALKAGFDTHVIAVSENRDFEAAMPGDCGVWDELVVAQERQILPLAIVYCRPLGQ